MKFFNIILRLAVLYAALSFMVVTHEFSHYYESQKLGSPTDRIVLGKKSTRSLHLKLSWISAPIILDPLTIYGHGEVVSKESYEKEIYSRTYAEVAKISGAGFWINLIETLSICILWLWTSKKRLRLSLVLLATLFFVWFGRNIFLEVLFLPTVFLCGLGIWLVIIRDTRRDGTENVTRNLSAFWEFGASPITLKNTVFFLAMITIVCTLCQIILPPADWQCVALKFFDDVSPGNGKAILHNFLGFYGKGMIFLLLISFLSSETKKTRSRNIF